jgi:hypothetical protein
VPDDEIEKVRANISAGYRWLVTDNEEIAPLALAVVDCLRDDCRGKTIFG